MSDTKDLAAVRLRWALGAHDLEGAIALREQVFCREQGVPRDEELDGRDGEALHLVALEPGSDRVIATLRLLQDGPRAKVGRVAVQHDWRRLGIAARMLQLALARAHELGAREVRLAAQLEAKGLYEQAGFVVQSDQFEEAGIPHVWMGLQFTDECPSSG
ncbi:MAG TPA: GNAT family N-acetyltransferase [Solirubrobacteraceae bacterium]|jgi:ElaA protein|nr:GNAT family N-acetyltransferase [Solirubrobacteraceae bacterium]